MGEVFVKVDDGWFTYWACKRCGKRIQLYVDDTPLPLCCPECGYGSDIKEEKKTMSKYVCPVCGKSYDTVSEMAKCALACDEKNTKAAAEKRIKAMNTAKEAIDNCYKGLEAMIAQFNKDYPEARISLSMTTAIKKKENKVYDLPNEWKVPLNFYDKKKSIDWSKINDFSSLIDAFIKEDS